MTDQKNPRTPVSDAATMPSSQPPDSSAKSDLTTSSTLSVAPESSKDNPPTSAAPKTKPLTSPVSRTAQKDQSKNWLLLGRTQGQRGAEIVAGLRATIDPTPENRALARFAGQIAAGKTTALNPEQVGVGFLIARPLLFRKLIDQAAASDRPLTIVELAAGFSARGLHLAHEQPTWRVIEIDLPDVVTEKQLRLRDAHSRIPTNLIWRAADLGAVPLAEVLGGEQVDVITAEGLLMYFNPDEQRQILRSVSGSLRSGGVFIFDVGWKQGAEQAARAQSSFDLFSKHAGDLSLGLLKDVEEAKTRYAETGFEQFTVHVPSELATTLAVRAPDVDLSVLVVAKKPSENPPAVS